MKDDEKLRLKMEAALSTGKCIPVPVLSGGYTYVCLRCHTRGSEGAFSVRDKDCEGLEAVNAYFIRHEAGGAERNRKVTEDLRKAGWL